MPYHHIRPRHRTVVTILPNEPALERIVDGWSSLPVGSQTVAAAPADPTVNFGWGIVAPQSAARSHPSVGRNDPGRTDCSGWTSEGVGVTPAHFCCCVPFCKPTRHDTAIRNRQGAILLDGDSSIFRGQVTRPDAGRVESDTFRYGSTGHWQVQISMQFC